MLIIYRLSNKEILFNSGKSFTNPQGMSDTNGKLAVIERIGGAFEDYGVFRLHDVNEVVQVDELLNAHEYNLVFDGSDKPTGFAVTKTKAEYLSELPPLPPPETDILGQQLVEKDLQILDLQQENPVLGQQLVDIDLRLLMGGM